MAGNVSGTEWLLSYVDPETQTKQFRGQKQFHNLNITVTPAPKEKTSDKPKLRDIVQNH